jgi:hypothetical protein
MTPGRKKRTPETVGRRKGTPNRKTIEQIEASGLTPLDHMLAVIRDPKAKPERRDEMAKAAAPTSTHQSARSASTHCRGSARFSPKL